MAGGAVTKMPVYLCQVPLDETFQPGTPTISMRQGQWDAVLAAAYADGWILLELDRRERSVRAYRRPEAMR